MSLRNFHAARAVLWMLFLPIVLLTDLKHSIPLLVAISIYANIASDWSAWQGARAENAAQES